MATTAYTEIIDRAKAAADMHDGFPSTTTWMYWLNAELRKLWVKIVRGGYPITINAESITITTATQYDIDEPFAVIGVVEIIGTKLYRVPIKPLWTKQNFSSTGSHAREVYVFPNVTTGKLSFQFYPQPSAGCIYQVYIIDKPKKVVTGTPATGQSNSVILPFGWEERVVLGMAQRALAAEETVNPTLEREIAAVDEQIDMHVHDYIMREANTVEDHNGAPYRYSNYSDWYYV
jgi:hypothetical protein